MEEKNLNNLQFFYGMSKLKNFWERIYGNFLKQSKKPPFFQDGGLCSERILADFQYVIEDIEFYKTCEFRFTINFSSVKT